MKLLKLFSALILLLIGGAFVYSLGANSIKKAKIVTTKTFITPKISITSTSTPSPSPAIYKAPLIQPSQRALKAASDYLALEIARGTTWDQIYDITSPSDRTQQTAVYNFALKLDKNPVTLSQVENEISNYNYASHPVILVP